METRRNNTSLISGALFLCLIGLTVFLFSRHGSHPSSSKHPPAPASREQIDESIATLEARVKPALESAKDPWALALGLRGTGPSFQLESQSLLERLLERAAPYIEKDQEHYRFSGTVAGVRVSPAPGALLAVLLESDVKLDRSLPAPGGPVDLATLASSFVKDLKPATTDSEWASFSWSLEALALALSHQIEPEIAQQKLATFSEIALDRLEREQRVFRQWLGKGEVSNQALPELITSLQERRGIYGFEGAGLHLMQVLLRGNGVLHDERNDRALRRLFGTALLRHQLEEPIWEKLLETLPAPQPRLIEAIDYDGRLLEVLGWIERITGTESADRGSNAATTSARVAAELVPRVEELAPDALTPTLRDTDPERYFAELAAASAALRGLHLARHFSHFAPESPS